MTKSVLDPLNFQQLPENSFFEQYSNAGVVYLQGVLGQPKLAALINEVNKAENHALNDLKENWKNRPTCFFTNNPDNEEAKKNAENFVLERYFQCSDDRVHVFFEEINGELRVNRLGHGLHRRRELPLMRNFIYNNRGLKQLLKLVGINIPFAYLVPIYLSCRIILEAK